MASVRRQASLLGVAYCKPSCLPRPTDRPCVHVGLLLVEALQLPLGDVLEPREVLLAVGPVAGDALRHLHMIYG